ncbi:hypothetical protein ACTXT7_010460 [Hymenolepis weldensis]
MIAKILHSDLRKISITKLDVVTPILNQVRLKRPNDQGRWTSVAPSAGCFRQLAQTQAVFPYRNPAETQTLYLHSRTCKGEQQSSA